MTYERNGKYDRSVPLRPDEFPVLCAPPYERPYRGWDYVQNMQQELGLLRRVVYLDDVPAMREFLRLVGPDVLYWCDDGIADNPTLIHATELGRPAILKALLDYRDSLTPEERDRAQREFELEETANFNEMGRRWGTPLTTACMCARADIVRLFLARMPEVDVNAYDKYGFTPLQALARHSHRAALSANGYGLDPAHHPWMAVESKDRITIVRMLLAHGARSRAPDKSFERVGQTVREAMDAWYDYLEPEYGKNGLQPFFDRPGGIGNALIQALTQPRGGDAALTRILVDEAGIDVHEGYFAATACFEGTGTNGLADDVNEGEQEQIDPDAAHKALLALYEVDPDAARDAESAAIEEKNRRHGPGQGPDTYLTPLAAAALFRNALGVEALLQIPGTDFSADLVAPSIPASFRTFTSGENGATASIPANTTAIRPLHAAMIGPVYKMFRSPLYTEIVFNRYSLAVQNYDAARQRAQVRSPISDPDPLSVGRSDATAATSTSAEIPTEIPTFETICDLYPNHERNGAIARKAFLDDCVTTVQLLTANTAICAATINATHPYVSAHTGQRHHYTPLHLGARFDRLPMLRVLLDRGANPSIPVPHTGRSVFFSVFASLLRLCSHTGVLDSSWGGGVFSNLPYQPQVCAIDASIGTAGMTTLVRDLLRPGPKPRMEAKEEAGTKTEAGTKDVARRLALVNEAGADGNTALHWAMGYGLPHARAALLALGARPGARNNAGEAPTEGTPPTSTRRNMYLHEFE